MIDEPEDKESYMENWDLNMVSIDPETGEETIVAEGEFVYEEPETRRGKIREWIKHLRLRLLP